MSFVFNLPNEHRLDFFKYFKETVNQVLCPFYVIPCRYSEEKDELIADSEVYCAFRQDNRFVNNPNLTFFEKKNPLAEETNFNGFSNYQIIENMVNTVALENNLLDIVIGYYDDLKKEFIQLAYIPNFYDKKTYGIVDYAYNESVEHFYKDEDMLDLRAEKNTMMLGDSIGANLTINDVLFLISELKKICIEGSFYSSYKNDIAGMNHDIANKIHDVLLARNITMGVNIEVEMNIMSYLKTLGVLEMYVTRDEKKFTPVTFLDKNSSQNGNKTFLMFLGFHPCFLEMLDDKYG